MKNIIHTQEHFTIYKEGQYDRVKNLELSLERFIYAKVSPAWDKLNYFFEHQADMSGYTNSSHVVE